MFTKGQMQARILSVATIRMLFVMVVVPWRGESKTGQDKDKISQHKTLFLLHSPFLARQYIQDSPELLRLAHPFLSSAFSIYIDSSRGSDSCGVLA